MLRSRIRRAFGQGGLTASENLPSGILTVPFVCSPNPEDWGDRHNEILSNGLNITDGLHYLPSKMSPSVTNSEGIPQQGINFFP